MFTRVIAGLAGGVLALGVTATSGAAQQVSGRVVFEQSPIAVDIVFGTGHDAPLRRARPVRRYEPELIRYRPGMSLLVLDRYLDRIEYEYALYRHMSARRARLELGWDHAQLRAYVRWLESERSYLRGEQARLRGYGAEGHEHEHGHGHGHGQKWGDGPEHGRRVAEAASHRW